MSKTNLINSLFKIDAAEGFVRYTNTVKPYHSKILDVQIEYVYKEDVRVHVTEKMHTDISQEKSTNGNCYFQAFNGRTIPGMGGSITVAGWHQPSFRHGDRFLVTYADGTSKVFIVDHAQNVEIIEPTDPYTTKIVVLNTQRVYDKTIANIQLSFAPSYRIVGAVSGDSGKWIVDGDVCDEFQPNEQVIIANTQSCDVSVSVFTIASAPVLGYAPGVGDTTNISTTYNIVGVKPTAIVGASSFVPGQWVIHGGHADRIVRGTHFSVSGNVVGTPVFYVVADVQEMVYDNLPTTIKTKQYTEYLGNDIVTVITIHSSQEIPPDTLPAGEIRNPIVPAYEIIGNTSSSWTIAGQYADRFVSGDRLFVEGNRLPAANKEYVIISSTNSTTTPYTTTVVVSSIPGSATASGHIQHPTNVTTIIPVKEQVFSTPPDSGAVYRPIGTGILRHLPLLCEQISEPEGVMPVGAVWLNPITNVSKRWNGSQWVHNYTPTADTWHVGPTTPSELIIKHATSPVDDIHDDNYGYSNSFVVDTARKYAQHAFSVISLHSNQLMFSDSYDIVGVDSITNKWTVVGVVDVYVGETLYITSSTSTQGLGAYTVARVVKGVDTTDIYVTKQISRLASADGILSIPAPTADVPWWLPGTRVRVTSTASLPNPLVADRPYYFVPIIKPHEVVRSIPSQEDIYNQWYRYSHGNNGVYPSVASELQAWTRTVSGSIQTTTESTSVIGFVSPDTYLKYICEVQIYSTSGRDGAGGVLLAWHRDDTSGKESTLTAVRSTGGSGYTWRVVYNLGQPDQWVVVDNTRFVKWGNGKYGQTPQLANYTPGQVVGGWDDYHSGTRIKVERDGSVFTCHTTDMNTTSYVSGASLRVDLTSDDRLNKFTGPRSFGVMSYAQPQMQYDILTLDAVTRETPAIFALSKTRKPRDFYDYVDVNTFGRGILTVVQDELYVPGTRVRVKDSNVNRNDGSYTILSETPLTDRTSRVFVAERIKSSTPPNIAVDGVMVFDQDTHALGSLTSRPCKNREQSELFADTRITEFIQFEFTVEEFDYITSRLRENEPYSEFLTELGFDMPAHDMRGFDGEMRSVVNSKVNGSIGAARLHSMMPIGFDTQYFDVGGLDETVSTLTSMYNRLR